MKRIDFNKDIVPLLNDDSDHDSCSDSEDTEQDELDFSQKLEAYKNDHGKIKVKFLILF